jgi:hypothetical protein
MAQSELNRSTTRMSEYQYYEFQAIDRALTGKQMGELRSCSSRARITPTSFVNEYSWGNFKGNEDAWMERYFDAFVYVANWGTHILKLRLPAKAIDLAETRLYFAGDCLSARKAHDHVVLTFTSEDESGGDWIEGGGILSSLIALRADLARDDRRALYLGWLVGAQNGELSDDDKEPTVPSGLTELTASLDALVEFLRMDTDLLRVAAEASAPLRPSAEPKEILAWLATVSTHEKDALLSRLLTDDALVVPAELRQRLERDRRKTSGAAKSKPRTVAALLRDADTRRQERRRLAAKKAAADQARKDRKASAARAKYLDALAGEEARLWTEVDRLVAAKLPKSYDAAVRNLVDLRDLAARSGRNDFEQQLGRLRTRHSAKRTLLERMMKAGL